MTRAKTKVVRQSKTPRQRAEEALGVTERLVDRLTKQRDKIAAELETTAAELEAATRRRDYLAQNPDLENPDVPLPLSGDEDKGMEIE